MTSRSKLAPLLSLLSCVGSLLLATVESAAQEDSVDGVAQFYRGRQVTIAVGTPPGSPASLYSQAVARHIGRHMPGQPGFIVQHMPGAGGLLAANTAYTTMPRDGTALVTTNSAIFIEPLLGGNGAQFDARRFSWIGGTHVEHMTCITWHTSAVRTLRDAMTRPAIIGSYGADGPSAVFAKAANTFAGTRFSLITGYSGSPEALLAMARGEVDGFCAMGWHELSLRQSTWLTERKVNILFQMGLEKDPEMPDVPSLLDHAKSPVDRRVLELLFTPLELGRPLYAPPNVSDERVQALRTALEKTLGDPQFLADAHKSGLPVQHTRGESIQRLIDGVYAAPTEVLDRAREMSK